MPLTGQAKTDYQRGYMRRRRSNTKPKRPTMLLDLSPNPVRPIRPAGISDNQWAYIKMKDEEGRG